MQGWTGAHRCGNHDDPVGNGVLPAAVSRRFNHSNAGDQAVIARWGDTRPDPG